MAVSRRRLATLKTASWRPDLQTEGTENPGGSPVLASALGSGLTPIGNEKFTLTGEYYAYGIINGEGVYKAQNDSTDIEMV